MLPVFVQLRLNCMRLQHIGPGQQRKSKLFQLKKIERKIILIFKVVRHLLTLGAATFQLLNCQSFKLQCNTISESIFCNNIIIETSKLESFSDDSFISKFKCLWHEFARNFTICSKFPISKLFSILV